MRDDDNNDLDSPAAGSPPPPRPPRDLAEAIGRAGAGNLKGASPVAAADRVLAGVGRLLEAHLQDPEGSLARTLLVRLGGDIPLLARHFEDPAGALAEHLQAVLARDDALTELVRETDARWGRDYDERPRFEVAGRAPAPDDPYTLAGVRRSLAALLAVVGR